MPEDDRPWVLNTAGGHQARELCLSPSVRTCCQKQGGNYPPCGIRPARFQPSPVLRRVLVDEGLSQDEIRQFWKGGKGGGSKGSGSRSNAEGGGRGPSISARQTDAPAPCRPRMAGSRSAFSGALVPFLSCLLISRTVLCGGSAHHLSAHRFRPVGLTPAPVPPGQEEVLGLCVTCSLCCLRDVVRVLFFAVFPLFVSLIIWVGLFLVTALVPPLVWCHCRCTSAEQFWSFGPPSFTSHPRIDEQWAWQSFAFDTKCDETRTSFGPGTMDLDDPKKSTSRLAMKDFKRARDDLNHTKDRVDQMERRLGVVGRPPKMWQPYGLSFSWCSSPAALPRQRSLPNWQTTTVARPQSPMALQTVAHPSRSACTVCFSSAKTRQLPSRRPRRVFGPFGHLTLPRPFTASRTPTAHLLMTSPGSSCVPLQRLRAVP